jgi:hypothetical protein
VSRSNTRNLITRLFVFVVTIALVGADLIVPAQNTNSSTTQNDNTSMQGGNMSGTNTNRSGGRRRRRRRGRRSSSMGMANANAACGPESTNMTGGMQENANAGEATGGMSTGGGGRRRRRGRRRSSMDTPIPAGQTSTDLQNAELERTTGRPEDLSGTYSGNLMMTGAHEMSGPATITIAGDQVTLEGQGMSHKGRISAVTTRGYTGATMYFPDVMDSATNTPLGVSVRAHHSGNSLTLTPLAGVRNGLSFTSGGGGMGGGRRGRRGRRRSSSSGNMTGTTGETAPTGDTSGNMNSTTPSDTSDTTNANMSNATNTNMSNGNMGGRRRRRGRRGSMKATPASTMNSNASGTMNTNNPPGNMNTTTPPKL